ncbi:MAG: YraN family protein [Alistipes sp.]|nr:YraN family protein [Alistipes sp.]
MNNKAAIGLRGEELATAYLRDNGYMICHRNWRNGRYEIDIVATKYGITHIVEVRTRRAGALVSPEMSINSNKATSLRRAAAAYLAQTRTQGDVAFDLIAVDIFPDNSSDVRFIENVIEFGW